MTWDTKKRGFIAALWPFSQRMRVWYIANPIFAPENNMNNELGSAVMAD